MRKVDRNTSVYRSEQLLNQMKFEVSKSTLTLSEFWWTCKNLPRKFSVCFPKPRAACETLIISCRCWVEGVDGAETFAAWNSSGIVSSIPTNANGGLDSCHVIDPVTNQSSECQQWVYDTTYHVSSRSIEWNMVCSQKWMAAVAQSVYMFGVFTGAVVLGSLADKYWNMVCSQKWMAAVAQSVYMFGVFTGAVVLGSLADKYGRKTIFCLSALLQLIFGVGVAFCPDFYSFLIARYVYGIFGSAGAYITGFVDGRVSAMAVVTRSRARGGQHRGKSDKNERSARAGHCALRVTFANSLAYYGLSLNTGKLLGNPFLMLFIVGLVEWPSYVATVLLMDRTGRRSLISALMLLGGIACLIALYIPQETPAGSITTTVVVMLGKFFIAGSFAIVYNYTAELFPTVLRNTALGVGSMSARFGGALTPLIGLLTMGKPMPQTLEDGEEFGRGDTACASCLPGRRRKHSLTEAEVVANQVALSTVD
ncbi:hypothetical protein B566_EDAN010329 [Ephemera danica]|nr:hypothetical protein B566_EDAN010329 [Ephemera danica]